MDNFSEQELDYLNGQILGRLATVGADGRPHATPVGFFYDADQDAVVIGGRDMAASKKYRDVSVNPEVAFVVDDLASTDPWWVRGVEIRGPAIAHEHGGGEVGERLGAGFRLSGAYIEIRPRRVRSWGLEGAEAAAPREREGATGT